MTTEQLITNAKNLNCDINQEYLNQIGVKFNGKHVWHWFNVHTYSTGSVFIDFNHSYSMNTGESKKGLRHSMKIKETLGFYDHLKNVTA